MQIESILNELWSYKSSSMCNVYTQNKQFEAFTFERNGKKLLKMIDEMMLMMMKTFQENIELQPNRIPTKHLFRAEERTHFFKIHSTKSNLDTCSLCKVHSVHAFQARILCFIH